MYTLILFMVMIIMPIPAIMRYMLSGRNAYRGILEGSLSAMTGVAILFLIFWSMTGFTLFDALNSILNQISVDNINFSSYTAMGLKKLEPDAVALALENMKEVMRLALPGTIIVFCMIIAYLNYAVISWFIGKTGRRISSLPPFRNFTLPKSMVLGSLLIYILSYITVNMGVIDKALLMFNLELLFTFIFSIQGLATIFYFGYAKKIPKLVILLVSGIFVLTWLGQTFLFLLGLTDLVFNIRKRFTQTNLKI